MFKITNRLTPLYDNKPKTFSILFEKENNLNIIFNREKNRKDALFSTLNPFSIEKEKNDREEEKEEKEEKEQENQFKIIRKICEEKLKKEGIIVAKTASFNDIGLALAVTVVISYVGIYFYYK